MDPPAVIIEEHGHRTGSTVAARVLERFEQLVAEGAFVKVMPDDYKRVLHERAQQRAADEAARAPA